MDKSGVGCLVEEPRAGPPAYWLNFELAEGWTAAYRVSYHGEGARRRARIRELRIVPREPFDPHKAGSGDFSPRRNYAEWETRTQFAGAPFSFDAIKRQITSRRFADVLASVVRLTNDKPEEWGSPAPLESIRPSRHVGRPVERTPDHYAQVAVRYDAIENNSRRAAGESTRAILAKQYKVPVTTIGKWLRIARQSGFLTPVLRGGRGGRATTTARDLLSKRGEK